MEFGLIMFKELKLIFLSICFWASFNMNPELFLLFGATYFRGVSFSVQQNQQDSPKGSETSETSSASEFDGIWWNIGFVTFK